MAIAANVAAIAASKALLFPPGLDAVINPIFYHFYRLIVNICQTSLFSRFLFLKNMILTYLHLTHQEKQYQKLVQMLLMDLKHHQVSLECFQALLLPKFSSLSPLVLAELPTLTLLQSHCDNIFSHYLWCTLSKDTEIITAEISTNCFNLNFKTNYLTNLSRSF